jgi:hypothetical protein
VSITPSDSTKRIATPTDRDVSHVADTEPTQRRRFIGQLVGGAAAMAAVACTRAVPAQAVAAAPAPSGAPKPEAAASDSAGHPAPAAHHTWDLSWADHIAGGSGHKQVFDAPDIAEGTVLHQARMFFVNYKDIYNTPDTDLRAVLVIRHRAIPLVLGDAVWAHYSFIGKKTTKLKDPTTGDWTQRNPFLNAKDSDKYALIWPDGGLDSLIRRGAIVLACNLAFTGYAAQIATRTKQDKDVVFAEFKAALVPGVTLVPSGVFGVIRAEQAGCAYIRAT